MQKIMYLVLAFLFFIQGSFAQSSSCGFGDPINNVCFTQTYAINPTSNNINTWYGGSGTFTNTTYDIGLRVSISQHPSAITPPTAIILTFTVNNAPMRVYLTTDACPNSSGNYLSYIDVPATSGGCRPPTYSLPIGGAGTYRLWFEGTSSANVILGGNRGTKPTADPIPETRGAWQEWSADCDGGVPFKSSHKSYQIRLNGVVQPTDSPLTYNLAPAVNLLCIKTYFGNPSGVEGLKKAEFNFGTQLTATPCTNTGTNITNGGFQAYKYNYSATWLVTYPNANTPVPPMTAALAPLLGANKMIRWNFNGLGGRGDAVGSTTTGSCLSYEFCFNVVATSNVDTETKTVGVFYPDGIGKGSTGTVTAGPYTYTCDGYCGFFYNGPCCIPNTCISGTPGYTCNGDTAPILIDFEDPAPLGVLPIELASFTAKYDARSKSAKVEWVTLSENNVSRYELLRSTDNVHFETIHTIRQIGSSTEKKYYVFEDKQMPKSLVVYYKLKNVDEDGRSDESSSISIQQKTKGVAFAIVPNPAKNQFILQTERPGKVEIYDTIGKRIFAGRVGEGDNPINLSDTPNGLYFVKVIDEQFNESSTQKLIVQ